MGDFNFEHKDLRDWMLDMGLLDVIGRHHGTDNVPKTWVQIIQVILKCRRRLS